MINISQGEYTTLIRTDEDQFNKRISLKSIIFNIEMNITNYIIVFHKVPSRDRFKKFIKAINEEYRLDTYHAKYARSVTEIDIDIKDMYTTFNNKRLSKKESKLYVNTKPMFGCIFALSKKDNGLLYNKPLSVTLYKLEEYIFNLFKTIKGFDKEEETVLIDFENIDF